MSCQYNVGDPEREMFHFREHKLVCAAPWLLEYAKALYRATEDTLYTHGYNEKGIQLWEKKLKALVRPFQLKSKAYERDLLEAEKSVKERKQKERDDLLAMKVKRAERILRDSQTATAFRAKKMSKYASFKLKLKQEKLGAMEQKKAADLALQEKIRSKKAADDEKLKRYVAKSAANLKPPPLPQHPQLLPADRQPSSRNLFRFWKR